MTVFTEPPSDFRPAVEASGVFIESNKRLLYLKRASSKLLSPNTWCIPGGKIEPGETPHDAAIREVFEEAGLKISHPIYLGHLYIRASMDYVFHIFRYSFELNCPSLTLNEESSEALWLHPEETKNLPLITPGGLEALNFYLEKRKPS